MVEVSRANQKWRLLLFLHSQHTSLPGLWHSPALIRAHCSSNDPTLLTSLWVLSAHPKHECKREEITLHHLWPLSSASKAGRCWLSAASAQPNPNNSWKQQQASLTFQGDLPDKFQAKRIEMLRGFCGAKSQCTKYRHKHLSPALPMWTDSGEQIVCCHNLGVRGRSQLHRMRVASSQTKRDELVLCGLFYSGIRGIAGEDGETACPCKGLPEQQHPWRKDEVFTMSSPFLPVISPAFHSSRWCPSIFKFHTWRGSVCQHISSSWGALTLVRLRSD